MFQWRVATKIAAEAQLGREDGSDLLVISKVNTMIPPHHQSCNPSLPSCNVQTRVPLARAIFSPGSSVEIEGPLIIEQHRTLGNAKGQDHLEGLGVIYGGVA
jgi:hypothetical protein